MNSPLYTLFIVHFFFKVDENGRSWRSGALVEKKKLSQWYFRITKLARELNDELSGLSEWPETVKELQRGWIGLKEGVNVNFIATPKEKTKGKENKEISIEIFTTKIQTLYGVTFLGLSADHPLINVKKGIISSFHL